MTSSWLYEQEALWIVAVLFGVMMLAAELAHRAGRRWHPRTTDAGRAHYGVIKGALLGLLALLLAFTFGMSAQRYETRQRLVLDEASVLHSLVVRSTLLPDEARTRFRDAVRRLVDARLDFFFARRDLRSVDEAIARTERIHGELWSLVREEALRNPQVPGMSDMLKSLIEAWTLHRQRVYAFEHRVPDPVIWLLLGAVVMGNTAVGFAGGLADQRALAGRLMLAVILSGTIYLVLDLDRPRRGPFQISQGPMLDLKAFLAQGSGGTPGAAR